MALYAIDFSDEEKKQEVRKFLKIKAIQADMSVGDYLYELLINKKKLSEDK